MTNPTDGLALKRKPRISYFLATAFGLGYLKPAPGTWGSLVGVIISLALNSPRAPWATPFPPPRGESYFVIIPIATVLSYILVLVISVVGVIVAGRVERYAGKTDPQFVVIDEVSGQMIAYSCPFLALNWKSWLLGFILFRVFDIWKPFPARQAESLPGGWGIMADDWVAGIYAALVLWGIQALGWLR
jgi:phosphatidylglycerophosphatase A